MSWFDAFFKSKEEKLKDVTKSVIKIQSEFDPKDLDWRVISFNFDFKNTLKESIQIELYNSKRISFQEYGISAGLKDSSIEDIKVFHKLKKLHYLSRPSESNKDFKTSINSLIAHTFAVTIAEAKEKIMAPPVQAIKVDEQQGLEWIRQTFNFLKTAMKEVRDKEEKVFECAIFMGNEPQTNNFTMRFLIFTLDIFFFFDEDNAIKVAVFDNGKTVDFDGQRQPKFQGDFIVYYRELFDEIIGLVNEISDTGLFKIS